MNEWRVVSLMPTDLHIAPPAPASQISPALDLSCVSGKRSVADSGETFSVTVITLPVSASVNVISDRTASDGTDETKTNRTPITLALLILPPSGWRTCASKHRLLLHRL